MLFSFLYAIFIYTTARLYCQLKFYLSPSLFLSKSYSLSLSLISRKCKYCFSVNLVKNIIHKSGNISLIIISLLTETT